MGILSTIYIINLSFNSLFYGFFPLKHRKGYITKKSPFQQKKGIPHYQYKMFSKGLFYFMYHNPYNYYLLL
jgi:hypothetical protein